MAHSVYSRAAVLKETISNVGEGPYHTGNPSNPPTPPFAKLPPVLSKMKMDVRSTDAKWPARTTVTVLQECKNSANSVASTKLDQNRTTPQIATGTKV